ncbi:MAG: hypothetical protein ISN28_10330 [Ectothiorhodospiraceae bacterium AqS1]|nr:hypothetical protein [Ectothiorhodospiraceae bacterium AqS1]
MTPAPAAPALHRSNRRVCEENIGIVFLFPPILVASKGGPHRPAADVRIESVRIEGDRIGAGLAGRGSIPIPYRRYPLN